MQENDVTWPQAMAGRLSGQFDVGGIPQTCIVEPDGVVLGAAHTHQLEPVSLPPSWGPALNETDTQVSDADRSMQPERPVRPIRPQRAERGV